MAQIPNRRAYGTYQKWYTLMKELEQKVQAAEPGIRITFDAQNWPSGEIRLGEFSTRILFASSEEVHVFEDWNADPDDWAVTRQRFRLADWSIAPKVVRYVKTLARLGEATK